MRQHLDGFGAHLDQVGLQSIPKFLVLQQLVGHVGVIEQAWRRANLWSTHGSKWWEWIRSHLPHTASARSG